MAEPNDALAQLRQQGETYDPPPPARFTEKPPPPIPEGFRVEPPDWRAEEVERVEREHLEREAEPPAREVEPAESLQSRPAPKRSKPKATPNLDKVRAMLDKGAP